MRFVPYVIAIGLVVCALLVPSCGGGPPATEQCSDGSCALECKTDSDCAQPVDKRCGAGKCAAGKCELEIRVGPIASQLYGDCQRDECDDKGAVVSVVDPEDVYDDGRECSHDYCQGREPINQLFPNGITCPEAGEGACYKGDCLECLSPAFGGNDYCGDPGYFCSYFYCLPIEGDCLDAPCGVNCEPCGENYVCNTNEDCVSMVCKNGKCQAATCEDATKNDKETGVDCGGPTCPVCPAGQGCVWPTDCESAVCMKGVCQAPSCFDGKKNGTEAGTDCGGPCDPC